MNLTIQPTVHSRINQNQSASCKLHSNFNETSIKQPNSNQNKPSFKLRAGGSFLDNIPLAAGLPFVGGALAVVGVAALIGYNYLADVYNLPHWPV